jgi:hypothetical protein
MSPAGRGSVPDAGLLNPTQCVPVVFRARPGLLPLPGPFLVLIVWIDCLTLGGVEQERQERQERQEVQAERSGRLRPRVGTQSGAKYRE